MHHSAANTDLATSEALKLSRQVDPDGTQTLAVYTKLDLMDTGMDAVDLLTGRIIPVKLGIIGVVNRSQQDITDDKPIESALKDEEVFLGQKYPGLDSRNGSPFLAQTLNKLLKQHIRDTLPVFRHDIASKLTVYESQLLALGDPVENKGPALLQTLTKFSSSYTVKKSKEHHGTLRHSNYQEGHESATSFTIHLPRLRMIYSLLKL